MKKILLVKPDFFDLAYTINPWMNNDVEVDRERALVQWNSLYSELKKKEIPISFISPQDGLCDMVFAANAGMVFNDIAVVSNFRDEQRKSETPFFTEWFKKNFKSVFNLSPSSIWEGQACSSIWKKNAIFSLSSRSNREAYDEILKFWDLSGFDVRFVDLIDPYFYHLDVCFSVLDEDTVVVCPLAFRVDDFNWIREKFSNVIEITYDDGLNFACNCFVFEKNIFLHSGVSNDLVEKLKGYGYNVVLVDVSEFIKAGGGVKCLIFEY